VRVSRLASFWPNIGSHLEIFANGFLRLIKSVIAPLLFGTLVSAMAGTTKNKGLGSGQPDETPCRLRNRRQPALLGMTSDRLP
jgi:hypothetical protein